MNPAVETEFTLADLFLGLGKQTPEGSPTDPDNDEDEDD
jgi:hypothetical protein